MHGDACANRRGSGLGERVYRDKSEALEMRAQAFAIVKSHPSAEAATRGVIRLFGLQTIAAPQVFYCESLSQIERAGGLKLPFGTRSAASQHGGPVSALRHPMSGDNGVEVRHNVRGWPGPRGGWQRHPACS